MCAPLRGFTGEASGGNTTTMAGSPLRPLVGEVMGGGASERRGCSLRPLAVAADGSSDGGDASNVGAEGKGVTLRALLQASGSAGPPERPAGCGGNFSLFGGPDAPGARAATARDGAGRGRDAAEWALFEAMNGPIRERPAGGGPCCARATEGPSRGPLALPQDAKRRAQQE